jgi:hypothetical protein
MPCCRQGCVVTRARVQRAALCVRRGQPATFVRCRAPHPPVPPSAHMQSCFLIKLLQIPQKLLVFENFFFVLEGLGQQPLPADVTTSDYKLLGSKYCKLSMPLAAGSPAALLPDPERYCFGSAFACPPPTP